MATKGNKSAGTQITKKGITQGNTLVGPISGKPIDEILDSNGVRRLAVDANFIAQNVQATVELDYSEDSISIGDAVTGNTLKIEDDRSINANIEVDADDGDNTGLKVQERNTNPDDTKYNKRVTATTGTVDTDTISLDVSIHDHQGNSFTESNQFPTNASIRDSVDPTKRVEVDTDKNLHVEVHGNDPTNSDKVFRVSELGAITPDGIYDISNNTEPGNVGLIAHTRSPTPDKTTQTERLTSVENSTNTVRALDIALHDSEAEIINVTNPLSTRLSNGVTNIATIGIGSETYLSVKKAEDPTYYIRIDRPASNITYIGKAYTLDASTNDPLWQITRTVFSGNEEIIQFANDTALYDKIWDLRSTYFTAPPFANSKSVQFDGANDYVSVDHNSAINFDFRTQAASFSCWIKTSNISAGKTYMEKQASNVGWRFQLDTNRLALELRGTGGTGDRIRVRTGTGTGVGTLLNNGSWHHIAATYTGSGSASGVTLYIDGLPITPEIQNDTLTTNSSNASNMSIAARSTGADTFGPGNIDEVAIWDVTLSAAEILSIYNSGVPTNLQSYGLSPISSSLVYWCRMGDGPDDIFPILKDIESGIIGTMTNMTPGDIEGAVPG